MNKNGYTMFKELQNDIYKWSKQCTPSSKLFGPKLGQPLFDTYRRPNVFGSFLASRKYVPPTTIHPPLKCSTGNSNMVYPFFVH